MKTRLIKTFNYASPVKASNELTAIPHTSNSKSSPLCISVQPRRKLLFSDSDRIFSLGWYVKSKLGDASGVFAVFLSIF